MKTSPMLEYHVDEYEQRLRTFCQNLNQAKIDGAIIANAQNIRYFSSFQSVTWDSKISTPAMVIISAGGEMAVISSASAFETVQYTSCLEDEHIFRHYNYNNRGANPNGQVELIHDVLRKMGIDKGRIGLEAGAGCYLHFPIHLIENITKECSQATFVDVSPLIWRQRQIKSFDEIAALRKACYIYEHGLSYAVEHMALGETTEQGFSALFAHEAFRRHAELFLPPVVQYQKEDDYQSGSYGRPDARIGSESGGCLQIRRGSVTYKGMHASRDCSIMTAKPTPKQSDWIKLCQEGQAHLLALVRNGADIQTLGQNMRAYFAASPVAKDAPAQLVGHGLGLDMWEAPAVDENGRGSLQTGMVLCLGVQVGQLTLEQILAVTDYGYELLTPNVAEIVLL